MSAPTLPTFTLADMSGTSHAFPTLRPTLLCFVKNDCPTCRLSLPLIEAAHGAFGSQLDVWAISQDVDGNYLLAERHRLALPTLDDSALLVSYRYDIETVPTIILADAAGTELRRLTGYRTTEWQALFADMAALTGIPRPEVPWDEFPKWRPGCGSKSVEPGIAERLAAQAESNPLRARRIEIAPADDEFEFMFDQGLTDGLPVVPPTPERVLRMLKGTKRDPQEVVAVVPPNMAPATVEKVAANAVMAGCKPEYLPVVLAALAAVCTDAFNIHGVMATTWGATPCLVVNGPIRDRIGMNSGIQALGYGNRANATIGRALKLVLRNLGGAKPGGIERAALASPAKYTMCFAENEELNPWEPLHVERGFRRDESVVTVFAFEGPRSIVDQLSRTARALSTSFGLALVSCWHPKVYLHPDAMLVICPEHVATLRSDGWSKADIRARIQEATSRPLRELLRDAECGEGLSPARYGPSGPAAEELEQRIPKFQSPANIHIVTAGGDAGKFSSIFGGWLGASLPVSRKIED